MSYVLLAVFMYCRDIGPANSLKEQIQCICMTNTVQQRAGVKRLDKTFGDEGAFYWVRRECEKLSDRYIRGLNEAIY